MRWLVLAAMLGCATSYQPAGITGGYSEMRLGERSYQVTFEGNGYTNTEVARRGALRRAAELAVHYGFFGFSVGGQSTDVDTQLYTQPLNCNSASGSTMCTGGTTTSIDRPTATITVNMLTEQEAKSAPPYVVVYEARMILAQGY